MKIFIRPNPHKFTIAKHEFTTTWGKPKIFCLKIWLPNGNLRVFGFHEKLNNLIKQCLSYVSISLLLNGSLHEKIIPTRGLHREPTISLFIYLFILWAEVLSHLLVKTEREDFLHGAKIAKGFQAFLILFSQMITIYFVELP